ncbi:TetR/AcrR family transcriptional regulator [Streptomyces sp. WAC08241]|uniref:TetR/AcrR family transcriptional regulator n=1 Tax=Streptomyces sp. WAC08241 TaxID=2487421 RepID=UPI000F7A9099|nr:TetR/AcrR family transcriptional regulator [Streptomyces sp. WAC08241]RSS34663.1 TetR/AcrR family transcriptional regulator [Streptomyces sp. WAC08241]
MDSVPQTRPQTAPALRRAPVQQRSAERLARILDACAVLLDETGYERLSTRAVAARAGVPIGSVYRFFGNKRAMVAALALRNLDRYAERVSERLAATPPLDAYGAIDGVLDEFIAMKRTVPGFALVDFGVPAAAPGEVSGSTSGEASGTGGDTGDGDADSDSGSEGGGEGGSHPESEDPNRLVAERICGLLAAHLGRPADEELHRKVLVGVETADALVRLAFRTDSAGDPALVHETRLLLYAYLAPSLS